MQGMGQRLIGADIELRVSMDASLGLVQADAGQLNQVLMNLVVNARDSMPKGDKLMIETHAVLREGEDAGRHETRPAGRYATLTVTDTGSGIDASTLTQIFEPFFTTKEPGKGTGLGLSTSYGIIQQHHGWIDVYSEVDDGTKITMFLPEAPGDAAGDVIMPKMNGPELAAHLNRSHPDIIVLYMSGYTDQALQNRGMIETGTAFLQKPFLPEALLQEVDRLLAAGS